MSNQRILFITRAYGQHAGGMERLSWELIETIKRQPGITAEVISHQGSRLTSPLFVFTCIPRAVRAARHAELIHLGDPLLSVVGWFVKRFFKKPVLVTVHGLDVIYPNPLYRLYLHLFFTGFDRYLAISRHAKELLVPWGVASKAIVLTPGITDHLFDPTKTHLDLSSLLPQVLTDQKVLLTVGRLVKRKGHEWFIRQVLPHLPRNTIYVIAGDGPERDRLVKVVEELQLNDQVVLLGKVSHEAIEILYNTVDTFVQPNISVPHDAEGFGLVLLEAALCKRPVFAANIDGIPDAVHHHKNGVLLSSGEAQEWIQALNTFVEQPQAYFEHITNPRHYTLDTFAWSKLAPRYTQAFLETTV
jgi:glycosyltransferase involved in cell wall biosynthesis